MSKNFTTPAGRCEWPKLQKPDCYQPKGDESDVYKYSVKMVIDPTDERWAQFLQELDMAAEESWAEFMSSAKKKKKKPDPLYNLQDQLDEEANETGLKTLSFGCRGRWWKDGFEKTRALPLFNALNKPFEAEGELGSGTVLKVSFSLMPYDVGSNQGVSLQLRAAKIIAPKYFGSSAENDFDDDETTEEDFEVAGQSMDSADGDY